MKHTITLKKLPYDREDENALHHCPVGGDENYEIICDNAFTIGHVYVSRDEYTADDKYCPVYLNWIEFLSIFRYKGLLRPTLDALVTQFGEVFFESSDENKRKYEHMKCTNHGKDTVTEMTLFSYK